MLKLCTLTVAIMLTVISSCLAQAVPPPERKAGRRTLVAQDQIAEELKQIRLRLERIEKRLAALSPAEESVEPRGVRQLCHRSKGRSCYGNRVRGLPVPVLQTVSYEDI